MLSIENDFIYITCTEQQAKQLDAVYVKSRNAYRVPNTLGALRELYKLGYDVKEYGTKKAAERSLLLRKKDTKHPVIMSQFLRPYQNQDVYFLSSLPHAAIFSEMRTGKTPMTLKLIEVDRPEKIIVICPASLVLNWRNEVLKWTSYTNVFYVKGNKKQRSNLYNEWNYKKGFLILSKDTAKSDLDLLDSTDYVLVVDESHFLRNYRTAQSKAIFALGRKAKKRIALTGTPAVNHPADCFGILHFLYPSKFPSYWQFVDRYFKTWDSPWGSKEIGKFKREEELTEILELISVQRKRSEVMQWIPPKQYQVIEVEMDAKQSKAYRDMLETFVVEEDSEIKADAPSVLAQLTRLRQICLSPSLLQLSAPSAKENFILEWLDDNPNESVVIFSNFSSYLKLLQKKIKGSRLIIGETPKQERQDIVDSFQDGKTKVILANIQAAGVGLTLDKAGTVIFLDRAYTPSENAQAEDRIVPTTESSNQNCLIIDVVCKDSIDQKIHSILDKKQSVIEVINNYRNIKELIQDENA